MILLNEIKSPIFILNNKYYLQHPTNDDLESVISELQNEDLDLRRLVSVKSDCYKSKGKKWLEREWQTSMRVFEKNFPSLSVEKNQIIKQMTSILNYQEIPQPGFEIKDPFNMALVETQKTLNTLRKDQLTNCIIVKNNQEIVAFGRLLEVEGSIEIVSIWTKKSYRKQSIAAQVIKELLTRSKHKVLFSFQTLNLIPYYLRQYNKLFPSIVCPFDRLPTALQRDLFRMNIFWGPNVIIRIGD